MMFVFIVIAFLNFYSDDISNIEKLQNKFENISNLQSDFVQSSNNKSLMKGKFFFLQKNNYRIELKNNTIISDGVSIWNLDKKRKKVIISSISDDPLAFSLREYIYDYPSICDISEETVGAELLLTLTPREADLSFKSAKLWISADYLINKLQVFDFGGNSFIFEFKNITINQPLANNFFTFQDDGKAKIIDLR